MFIVTQRREDAKHTLRLCVYSARSHPTLREAAARLRVSMREHFSC
jgi:hypothetical protein